MATNDDVGVEDAAAGKSHNVIQEAVGTGVGAVLVVDLRIDVAPVGGSDDAGRGLIIVLGPAADENIVGHLSRRNMRSASASQMQAEEQPAVPLKPRGKKVGGQLTCLMGQQLRFHAQNSGRGLQGFDDVFHHLQFDGSDICPARRDKKVAYYSFAAFIHKERIAYDAAPLDRGIARQNFGVHVTQNHLRRTAIVPGEEASPGFDFFVEKGTQVGRREVPEVENLHVSQLMRPAIYRSSHRRGVQRR